MSKAPFISVEWQGLLERAARAAGGFTTLEEQFHQLRRDLMADYDKLKAEVDETLAGVKSVIGYVGAIRDELKAAQANLAAGNTIDYSDLVAKLDAAQADMSAAITPAEKLPEQVEAVVEAAAEEAANAPVSDVPPAEPTS